MATIGESVRYWMSKGLRVVAIDIGWRNHKEPQLRLGASASEQDLENALQRLDGVEEEWLEDYFEDAEANGVYGHIWLSDGSYYEQSSHLGEDYWNFSFERKEVPVIPEDLK